MITTPVITGGLNAIFLALTPIQRWEAMRRFDSGFMTERWFIITGVVAIIILTALLFAVSFHRKEDERRLTNRLFVEYADKRGLSERERQILLVIARQAGLKRGEAIFTMGSAFDRGVAKIVEESFAKQQTAEGGKQLKAELSFLREKLGFQKQPPSSVGSLTRSRKLSSRQIPTGKKLHINRRKAHDSKDMESTVIKNDDMELTVKLAMPVEYSVGELWRARYYFGSSVWEFDTSLVSCDGNILVLNHSDNVRFINRRRFLRVSVNKPAFVAHFPFSKTFVETSDSSEIASGGSWGPPEFVPAVVTELAGPGLRIETRLETKVGERLLVVFRLDEGKKKVSSLWKTSKASKTKMIEDIGEVRHIKAIQNGLSVAVELTGLRDSDVNELIRATNAASVRAGAKGQDISGSANAEGGVPEAAVVQGDSIL